jgi:hypothetical protein
VIEMAATKSTAETRVSRSYTRLQRSVGRLGHFAMEFK